MAAMPILRRLLLALLFIVAAPAHAAGDADWLYRGSDIERDPAWTFGTLPNGVRYAVGRNALPAGQVSIRLRIDAGSLHERDDERGFAHYVEHLAFRGTKSFADREARRLWQNLGASFGSDTNATTSPTQTVYQLDLPKSDRASLDASVKAIAEMADSALLAPAAVEAERQIVLAEKRRRPEIATLYAEKSWPLFYAGLKLADRDPIGTDETLRNATAPALRAFYERWYRPDRATVIMVGDADPAMMEALIAEHFGGWRVDGPPPPEPDFGTPAEVDRQVATLAYPGAPPSVGVMWLRPYRAEPNTIARERADLATSLAQRILNRRLEAKARGDAAFLSAGVNQRRSTHVADMTQLSITAREGRWRESLAEVFAIIADARATPPSEAEITRELANLRTAALSGLESEPTIRSQQRAQQLISAIDGNSVVTTAATSVALLESLTPEMTPEAVGTAMGALFEGLGPRLFLLTPDAVKPAVVETAFAAARDAAPAVRTAGREVSFDDLPALGPPGKEVSRERIEDLGVTIVRFANGASLTFKQTDFEKGSVAVQLRFGNGIAGIDPAKPSPLWLAGVIGPSGLADLDLDALERLLTGRRIGLSFAIDENAFVLRGLTNGQDLGDQLRLMATKLAFPRWDQQPFGRLKSSALESYELGFASATARAGREASGFTRRGDERWVPVTREEIVGADFDRTRAFFDPLLAEGPIEAVIVGDVDLETAAQAMARTIGTLPPRQATEPTPAELAVRTPDPSPTPVTFTHTGDADEAYAMIGWNTFGGTDRRLERRALSLAANIFQVRLFDRLREEEGATYSPSAISSTSQTFPDWGIFYAAAEIKPESAHTFFRITREIVKDLATTPAGADEFARARNQVISGIERRVKTNGYWLQAMEGWTRDPELIELTRSFLADYSQMTAESVRRAVATHVADEGDWSLLVLPDKNGDRGQ